VAIEGILIKDIIFSAEVAASLSSAAQQKRIGESKVIAARAEVDSARLMRQAADILASPAAMQIRQLEALQAMAKSGSSKVIFVPMQLQSDVVGAGAAGVWNQGSGSGQGQGQIASGSGIGNEARSAGILSSMADI
jgi:erythrocyte band 7 integral membrane protein